MNEFDYRQIAQINSDIEQFKSNTRNSMVPF